MIWACGRQNTEMASRLPTDTIHCSWVRWASSSQLNHQEVRDGGFRDSEVRGQRFRGQRSEMAGSEIQTWETKGRESHGREWQEGSRSWDSPPVSGLSQENRDLSPWTQGTEFYQHPEWDRKGTLASDGTQTRRHLNFASWDLEQRTRYLVPQLPDPWKLRWGICVVVRG